jgi:hypothetical protein
MQRLSEFNEKSERLFELEKAASIDPRQILPNMFSVVRDFANNLEVLGSSVSFLFYHERYFASSSLSEHEAEQSLVVAAINEAKDGLDGTVRQISEHSTRFSRGAVDPIEVVLGLNLRSSKPSTNCEWRASDSKKKAKTRPRTTSSTASVC